MTVEPARHDFASIKAHMARGTIWMVVMRWSMRVIGLINTLIIARLLTPADFGISTMAWIVVEFLMVLSDSDVEMGLLRGNHFTRDYLDTAWTVKIAAGMLTFGMLLLVAPLAAAYYGDPRVPQVIRIVALRALIMGFENIGVVEFRHTLGFAKEYRYVVWQRAVMLIAGLSLAFWLRNYLALAIAAPLGGAVAVAISFAMSSYRPRLSFVRWRELWSFSQWRLLHNTARFLNDRIDQFVIGGIGSAADIGRYYVASDIATLPTREVIWPMGRALTPTLAKIVHDPAEMKKAWVMTFGFVAVICLSAGVGMSMIADDAVLVLLGDQWRQSAQFFRWLALYGVFEGLFLSMEAFFIARRHERAFALFNLAQFLSLTPLLVIAGHWHGLAAIAIIRMMVVAATVVVMFFVMIRMGWVGAREIVAAMWRPAIAATVMAAGVTWLHHTCFTSAVASLGFDIVIGATMFVVTLYGLWWLSDCPQGPESTLLASLMRNPWSMSSRAAATAEKNLS